MSFLLFIISQLLLLLLSLKEKQNNPKNKKSSFLFDFIFKKFYFSIEISFECRGDFHTLDRLNRRPQQPKKKCCSCFLFPLHLMVGCDDDRHKVPKKMSRDG
jgi:hypothetical protein